MITVIFLTLCIDYISIFHADIVNTLGSA